MADVALVAAVLALASVLGVAWRARNGRFRPTDATASSGPASVGAADRTQRPSSAGKVLTADEVGTTLGERATFVQLSSEVCAACRSTRTVLAGVVADEPGVVHVELDVAEHLDLVRRLGVMRTPTTLVLGHDGRVVGRMSGATDRRQALAALDSCPAPGSCPGTTAA